MIMQHRLNVYFLTNIFYDYTNTLLLLYYNYIAIIDNIPGKTDVFVINFLLSALIKTSSQAINVQCWL